MPNFYIYFQVNIRNYKSLKRYLNHAGFHSSKSPNLNITAKKYRIEKQNTLPNPFVYLPSWRGLEVLVETKQQAERQSPSITHAIQTGTCLVLQSWSYSCLKRDTSSSKCYLNSALNCLKALEIKLFDWNFVAESTTWSVVAHIYILVQMSTSNKIGYRSQHTGMLYIPPWKL